MDSTETTLVVIGFGFLMFGIGFNWRDRSWGLGLIALGIISVLSMVAYKMYLTFH